MMNKIIGLAVLLLCMSGCVRDNDAIYYPVGDVDIERGCLLYTSPSPRDRQKSRMPSSA